MIFNSARNPQQPITLGVAGTGFIGGGFLGLLQTRKDFRLGKIYTRRSHYQDTPASYLTNDLAAFIGSCDIVVECTGDIARAASIVQAAVTAGKPVVSLAAEFQVTLGSYFADKGIVTEAEGDQPGSLAALREEAVDMGFEPLVYGNMKGFLNHLPSPEEMMYWSERNGISQTQVTSFTDGTKLQIEQALVANGLGATIVQRGLVGPKDVALDVASGDLARKAKALGQPVSDYLLNRKLPAGVFIVAEHQSAPPEVLRYLKMGEGPFYTVNRDYHLCHLEVFKTLKRVANGGGVLLNNSSQPTVNIAAVAKRALKAGEAVEQAIGGYQLRGEAVKFADAPEAVPMGLLQGAVIEKAIQPGQTVTWADVALPNNLATELGYSLYRRLEVIKG